MSTELPRMRIERGRVMHRVRRRGDEFVSLCLRPHPVRGVGSMVPRTAGPVESWTVERRWYSDCTHCPPEAGDGAR